MDIDLYHTELTIILSGRGTPTAGVRFDGNEMYSDIINNTVTIRIIQELTPGEHVLTIEHKNKHPNDSDTELMIESISFNGITSNKFAWQGVYAPIYPEPWATEQRNSGHALARELTTITHLGWNGQWTLTFTAPVFTWIHQVEDLGWIYQ